MEVSLGDVVVGVARFSVQGAVVVGVVAVSLVVVPVVVVPVSVEAGIGARAWGQHDVREPAPSHDRAVRQPDRTLEALLVTRAV